MAGRPRKPIAQKKLEGTYTKYRDEEREKEEQKIALLLPQKHLKVPKTITNPEVKKAYKNHVELLRSLGGMAEQIADSPILESAYYSLQVAYEYREIMNNPDLTTEEGIDKWGSAAGIYLKFMERFEKITKDFYLTPKERAKLKLDVLTATEKEQNIEKNKSVIASLLEKKQS